MRPRLVQYLACPDCGGDLGLERESRDAADAAEIVEGELGCRGCGRRFPIVRGVPRLVASAVQDLAVEVAAGFGWEWNQFDEIRPQYHRQFLDWVRPFGPDDFHGKRVLDGGCGKGRHATLVAGYGAEELFAIDLGSAVEACYRNTRHLRSVHVIQGDLNHPPLKRCVDVAYSVGVLHHLPDPAAGFRALVDKLVPGGRVVVWVYGYEGNEWIVRFIDPIRKSVASRMPKRLLYELARPLGYLVAAAAKGLYRPLAEGGALSSAVHGRLFYKDYLTYIAQLPTREIHSIVFDQLLTPVAHYMRREDVESMLRDPRLEDVEIHLHNSNSWRANGRVAAPATTSAESSKESSRKRPNQSRIDAAPAQAPHRKKKSGRR